MAASVLTQFLERWVSLPRLHHLLPYESYDATTQLFYNQNSTGFVLDATPIVGASLSDQDKMAQFFRHESNLPEGASLQFLLFASPCIGPHLAYWQQARKGDVFQKLAARRRQFLETKAYVDSEGLMVRDYRLLISYTVPGHVVEPVAVEQLLMVRKELRSTLEELGVHTTIQSAEAFISDVGTLLNLENQTLPHPGQWQELDSLAQQMIDCERNYHVTPEHVALNDGQTLCRSFIPKQWPKHWSLGNMDRLLGDLLKVKQKIGCPFLIHYGLFVDSHQGQAKAKALSKRESLATSLRGGFAKFMPNLREEYEESDALAEQVQQGERVILSSLSCTLFSPPQEMQEQEQRLKSIWQDASWSLQPTRYDHLLMLLASLPMTWTNGAKKKLFGHQAFGLATDLAKLGKAKKTITKEAQNLLPIVGEWKGQAAPGMPLIGRRGQLFFWNPFGKAFLPGTINAQTDHNYNVCIAGQAGSGKSVFMNELMATVMGVGGKVFVLDYGRSFKKNCQILGGQHMEFDIRYPISINPFTHIPTGQSADEIEDRDDMIATLAPMFQVMAAPKHGTTDLENAYIEQAIRWSWQKYGPHSSVDTVREFLTNNEEKVAKNLAQTLYSFSSEGSFGHFFNQPSTASFKERMVVIETDHLRNHPNLMAVVVQMLMVQINQEMAQGDRQTPFLIIIDEAWKILGGKNTGAFITEISRIARKYKGALVLATQHLTDYFKPEAPGATEAFNSSAWKCILYQEADVIGSLKHHPQLQGFVENEYKEALLKSIHSKPPHYSEAAIFGPGAGGVVGRLRLDPFSRLLYSTNPEEYNAIDSFIRQGASIEAAIEAVIEMQEGRTPNLKPLQPRARHHAA